MNMTWAQIRKHYLKATGNRPAAEQEWEDHLTEGYRRVTSDLDIPELQAPEVTAEVEEDPANPGTYLDYVNLFGMDVYAIDHVVNITEGFPVYPEPIGAAGRARYIEKTTGSHGMPPKGEVTHWVRSGDDRLLVRDRPRDNKPTRLQIYFKIQPPQVEATMLNDHPITPPQYDMAIVHRAAESFFLVNGAENRPMGEGQPVPSYMHDQAAQAVLQRSMHPKVEEDRKRYERVRLRGYSVRGGR